MAYRSIGHGTGTDERRITSVSPRVAHGQSLRCLQVHIMLLAVIVGCCWRFGDTTGAPTHLIVGVGSGSTSCSQALLGGLTGDAEPPAPA
jgi:hypothetical protein